jgi:hypothetical protein
MTTETFDGSCVDYKRHEVTQTDVVKNSTVNIATPGKLLSKLEAEELTQEVKKLLRESEKIGDQIIKNFSELKRGIGLSALGFNKPNPWPEYFKQYFPEYYNENPRYLRHLANVATFHAERGLGYSAEEIGVARLVCKKSQDIWGEIWSLALELNGGETPDKAIVTKAIAKLEEKVEGDAKAITGHGLSQSENVNETESANGHQSDEDSEPGETQPDDPNMPPDGEDKQLKDDPNSTPLKGDANLTKAGSQYYRKNFSSASESEKQHIREFIKERIRQLEESDDPLVQLGLDDLQTVLVMINSLQESKSQSADF